MYLLCILCCLASLSAQVGSAPTAQSPQAIGTQNNSAEAPVDGSFSPAASAEAIPGVFPLSNNSIAGQSSVAGLPLLPTFTETDYLLDLQERQRFPEASDFVFDFANQARSCTAGQLQQALVIVLVKAVMVCSSAIYMLNNAAQSCPCCVSELSAGRVFWQGGGGTTALQTMSAEAAGAP